MDIKRIPSQPTFELRLTLPELRLIHLALGFTCGTEDRAAGLTASEGAAMYDAITDMLAVSAG